MLLLLFLGIYSIIPRKLIMFFERMYSMLKHFIPYLYQVTLHFCTKLPRVFRWYVTTAWPFIHTVTNIQNKECAHGVDELITIQSYKTDD